MTTIAAKRLAKVFVEVADTLVDDFDLIEFLQMVTAHTSDLISARVCGLLLADDQGRLQLMAASDEGAEMLEIFQVQSLEGPCQDCFSRGEAVINADLAQAQQRWPKFAPHAVAAGFRSVHAFPLRLRGEVIGALNLFGTEPGEMDATDVGLVQALADIATIGLLQERSIARAEVLAEQLQAALNSRIVIEQAKGALAQIHGGTTDQAFHRLRSYSRSRGLKLSEVAHTLTTEPERLPDLISPGAR